ncbi:hypothetical protein [Deinococcus rufus]|uniref:Uncharacterized protein n=1 Tax=Deinococcus rufus TaxID=2136097 RepID=A0ABV7Z913_9DEIO
MTETVTLTDGTDVVLVPWTLDEAIQNAALMRAAVERLTAPLRGGTDDSATEQGLEQLRQVIVPSLQDPAHAPRIALTDLGPVLDAVARVNRLDRLLGTAMKLHLRFVQARALATADV